VTGRETVLTSNLSLFHKATHCWGYKRQGPIEEMPSCVSDRCKGFQEILALLGSVVCVKLNLTSEINVYERVEEELPTFVTLAPIAWGDDLHPLTPLRPRKERPVPIGQKGVWGPGPV
jgi:hypothetical protein